MNIIYNMTNNFNLPFKRSITSYFPGLICLSSLFCFFLFCVIFSISHFFDLFSILFYDNNEYLYSFIIFSYHKSDKDSKHPDNNNMDEDDDDDCDYLDDDEYYFEDPSWPEPGSKSYTGEGFLFAFGGEYVELPQINDPTFTDKISNFINSIELKDKFAYYVSIHAPIFTNTEMKYGNVLMENKENIYSLLIFNEEHRKNINYKVLKEKAEKKLLQLIYMHEEEDDSFGALENNLYISCKEINLSDKDSSWKFKVLNLSNIDTTNAEITNLNKGLSTKNKEFVGGKVVNKRSYSTTRHLPAGVIPREGYLDKNVFGFDEKSPMSKYISSILNSKLPSRDKQIKIENTLNYFWKEEFEKLIKNSDLNTNKYGLNIFIKEYKSLGVGLNIFLKDKNILKHKPYMKVVKILDMSLIVSMILSKLVPFLLKNKDTEEQNLHELYKSIGRSIFNEYVIDKFKKQFDEERGDKSSKLSFYDFKLKEKNGITEEDIITIGFTLLSVMELSSSLFTTLSSTRFNVDKGKYETMKYYLPTEELLSILNDIMISDIEELPLVSEPEKWEVSIENGKSKIIKYGGYLLNNINVFNGLIRRSPENVLSDTSINNDIVDCINYMSSIPFSINKKVLEILLKDNDLQPYLNSLHNDTSKLKEYHQNKYSSSTEGIEIIEKINEITDHNSKFYYYNNIINIAKLYVNQIFYFTFFLDWRGRVYSQSGALNFQAGDFAKSLLLFSNGCVLNEEGLRSLKVYIANLYGKDKVSHEKRIEWVDKNINEILDVESGFWKTADEPYSFLAASLEYKEYLANPDKFISKLPILLDATCNGLQHLAAMSKDINLAKKVNLLSNNSRSDPEDCYSLMIEPIKSGLNDLIEKEPKYANLGRLEIKRMLIKRSLMTIPYGATVKGIHNQLIKEHFTLLNIKKDGKILYQSNKDIGDALLTYKEIYMLSSIIYKSLFNEHPMLNELVNYLIEIVKLLNQLNLPIIWLTPSGLLINQKYSEFSSKVFSTKIFGKRKTLTLREIKLDKKTKKSMINKQKQINAFVPNFIHSMDSANIALLVKEIKNLELNERNSDKSKSINLLTIHDCFGTSANDASKLSYLVKNAFMYIYSNSEFLNKFHNFIIEYIEKNNFEIINDKTIVLYNNHHVDIPRMPKLGVLNIKDQLPNSLYFIN